MLYIQDREAEMQKGKSGVVGDFYVPLTDESNTTEREIKKRGCWICCCRKSSRRRPKRRVSRRVVGAASADAMRMTFVVMSLVLLGAAFYLDDLINATPNIIMDDPNSPDTEELLITVEEFKVRRSEIELKFPISTNIAAKGYIEKTTTYEKCRDYDDICRTLLRDGKIWFLACIVGMGLALLGSIFQGTLMTWKKMIKLLSFLTMLDVIFIIVVWWLDVYLKLCNTKTASFPFYSTETNQTTLIEMTFEDKGLYPGYSLALASMCGLALVADFVLEICY